MCRIVVGVGVFAHTPGGGGGAGLRERESGGVETFLRSAEAVLF